MIKALISATALTLTLWGNGASAQAKQVESSGANGADPLFREFELCLSDSLIGLDVARAYFSYNKSRKEALETAAGAGEAGALQARKLFDGSETGAINNAYQFAQESLFSCMQDAKFPVDDEISKESAQVCFYRSDALFFAFTSRATGMSKDEARQRIASILKSRNLLPSALISKMVDLVYSRSDDVDELIGGRRQFVKSCLVASNES